MGLSKHLSVACLAAALSGAALAQQKIPVDFMGESTFRGAHAGDYNKNGVVIHVVYERDHPAQARCSNHDRCPNPGDVQPLDFVPIEDNAAKPEYNVPRRVVEILNGKYPGSNYVRNNFAISATTSDKILNGITFKDGVKQSAVATLGGASEAGVVALNTGINDAANGVSVTTARSNYKNIIDRLLRTGHKVVMVQPNYVTTTYANQLKALFEGASSFQDFLNSLGAEFDSTSDNVTFIPASSLGGTSYTADTATNESVHPSANTYDSVAVTLASKIDTALIDTAVERQVAQEYVLFFNRAVESGGANYWRDRLKVEGEINVATAMFYAAPDYKYTGGGGGYLTPTDTVKKWYSNLWGTAPDPEGLQYWVDLINKSGVGTAAVTMLNVVRAYGYNEGEINTANGQPTTASQADQKKTLVHRTNAGVGYGFRLKCGMSDQTADKGGIMSTITKEPATVYNAMKTTPCG